jgi:hypothetical protein
LYFNPCLYALTAFCGLFSMLPVWQFHFHLLPTLFFLFLLYI